MVEENSFEYWVVQLTINNLRNISNIQSEKVSNFRYRSVHSASCNSWNRYVTMHKTSFLENHKHLIFYHRTPNFILFAFLLFDYYNIIHYSPTIVQYVQVNLSTYWCKKVLFEYKMLIIWVSVDNVQILSEAMNA